MTRGVRLYLVGSFVLVSLAGCGRGFFQSEEREPWRAEAEIACLKSGAVKENPDLVRISPISGPGVCGAEFPLKVAALGEGSGTFGFADESLRPPGSIGNQPRWPVAQPAPPPQAPLYPDTAPRQARATPRHPGGPISLTAPGVSREEDDIDLPPEGAPGSRGPSVQRQYLEPPTAPQSYPPRDRYSQPYPQTDVPSATPPATAGYPTACQGLAPDPRRAIRSRHSGRSRSNPPRRSPARSISVLDHWLADSVQPAAQLLRFGARVVEIKQISAYSCRGMNGNANAHISEHAFGNALDIAAFTLADGRRISVETGWKGMPEEQGFLRDVQASACREFTTVLAPGSNVYHYNHIHVDLMRRPHRPIICEPAAVSGEEVAARAADAIPMLRANRSSGSLGKRLPRRAKATGRNSDASDDWARGVVQAPGFITRITATSEDYMLTRGAAARQNDEDE